MSVRRLPRVVPFEGDDLDPTEDHPMRRLTLAVAFEDEGWTRERAAQMRGVFDRIAPEWHTRDRPERLVPVRDALDRGGPFAEGPAVELGSGTGIATATLASRLPLVAAVDLSLEMLERAPDTVARLAADGARLPFRDRSLATLALVNMLLFPVEVDRVLAAHGAMVWVSTAGASTPIYLSPEELDDALPGDWDVVTAEAGRGSWSVARRVTP